MQLSKIKIAGFKSFVDPTVMDLPSKLVAIVGPNGCGKSNIIDAVTWVMGESSPKYLRGESLTDVIFNGSSARKPVGQASVELIFDNSDGTIGGEFANFAEISVKRMINRESDSTYYLNGARCRKRDIVDIFLGTGLGPRSYSIIGQNMISRIIEAKPDDLRTYLEEAAGISKYKDRRHETELRINHTKENLARVNDLQVELDKQLSHLKHQANIAEKYKTLKQQERVLRAELYGVQWRQLDSKMVDYTLQIQREETALEGRQSDLISTDREMEEARHEQRVAHDAFQEIQRRYYSVGNEITRIEQDIVHHQEKRTQWENDLKQAMHDNELVQEQMQETEDAIGELEQDIMQLEPEHTAASKDMQSLQHEVSAADEAMQDWQSQWDEFNALSAKTAQTAQVEKTHIQHLEQRLTMLQKREAQLQQDKERFNFSELTKELEVLSRKNIETEDKLDHQQEELDQAKKEILAAQKRQQDANSQLDTLRNELQKLRGQQASLEALQQTALGKRDNAAAPWIAKHNLGEKNRLAQLIQVENGWEFAAEKVLGFCLQAICVSDLNEVLKHIEDFKAGDLCVFTNSSASTAVTSNKGSTLLEKIKSPYPLDSLLSGIYIADSLEGALALCESLNANESVITRDGTWLNRSWLKILREENPAAGVFQREQELKQLALRIEQLEEKQEELEKALNEAREAIAMLEQQRDQLQQSCAQLQSQAAQASAEHKMKQARLTELKAQSERFMTELQDCTEQLRTAENELVQARSLWEKAMSQLESQSEDRESLMQERDLARQKLQMARENANQKKERMHEVEIRLQTARSQKASQQQNIVRLKAQLALLEERKITLESELSAMLPVDDLKETLTQSLDKHSSIEAELNKARIAVESLDQEFRQLEEKRQTIEREINKVRTTLESLRVEWQGWKVKAESLSEQIKETEFTLEDILKQLPNDISVDGWQIKLDQTVQRINRLGPINLVAIDEYATCSERKQYLDKQVEDLQAGLVTLEDAIAKIDKETRQRFKETFDKVNNRFQELFPTIFGGGKAYLELNSDDLLTAGVTMMACPPGKRNSTIYLLSGGEKSLTAIALIFSIFHLNPAPFCLLDEVDAALDDANVSRFTRLVKTMVEKTQFLFISHNKITIEMGEHLIGVTMNEPGVSRLVSVDMQKAIDLAGS